MLFEIKLLCFGWFKKRLWQTKVYVTLNGYHSVCVLNQLLECKSKETVGK